MKILRTTDRNFRYDFGKVFRRVFEAPEAIVKQVTDIIDDVRRIGDQALFKYTIKHDQYDMGGKGLEVTMKEINSALKQVSAEDKKLLDTLVARAEEHYKQEPVQNLSYKKSDIEVKSIRRPLGIVGIYVPGGKASYATSLIPAVVAAKQAGVKEIIICTPWSEGKVPAMVLAAASAVGIKRVFKLGGAQAIAAMAYGTKSVPKVDKIVGAGGLYVTLAKKMVFGDVAIDMLSGPSELVILGDGTISPAYVASDLVAQSELDELSCTLLITNNSNYAIRVEGEVRKQLLKVSRKAIASESVKKRGLIVLVRTLKEGLDLINEMAPENLQLCVKDADKVVNDVDRAGKIFVGALTPEVLGDYVAGPAHMLPTYGSAKFFSGLTVQSFTTEIPVIKFNETSFKKWGPVASKLATSEGLSAHATAIEIRLKDL